LDNIELGLELLTVFSPWEWTQFQLDKLFLPMIARLSSSAKQPSANDSDVAVAQVMLGIIGSYLTFVIYAFTVTVGLG